MTNKYINLNPSNRFVPTNLLRNAYLNDETSRIPNAPNFITLGEMELGIVSSQVPQIALAISSILSRSLEDAKCKNGGHLPSHVVERVQMNIISPYGISELWGRTGYRFVLSRPSSRGVSEILAAILVGADVKTLFFFTSRYSNLDQSTLQTAINFNEPAADNPDQKWLDLFAFPPLDVFKPKDYHQIANFVVNKEHRGQRLGQFFLKNIVQYYSSHYIQTHQLQIEHAQPLLAGRGFWQLGDPPWLVKMQKFDFYLRAGAESFFIEQEWASLPPIYQGPKKISNLEYNASFGLPGIYDNWIAKDLSNHLAERIPEVCALAQNPNAKLQYFQIMFDF